MRDGPRRWQSRKPRQNSVKGAKNAVNVSGNAARNVTSFALPIAYPPVYR